jgi:hypothetical protein
LRCLHFQRNIAAFVKTIMSRGAFMTAQQSAAAAPIDQHTQANMRKVALTSLAGTSIEWYDFFLYGTAAALVFPILFFPADMPPMVALIASFSTFAIGFLAREVINVALDDTDGHSEEAVDLAHPVGVTAC